MWKYVNLHSQRNNNTEPKYNKNVSGSVCVFNMKKKNEDREKYRNKECKFRN